MAEPRQGQPVLWVSFPLETMLFPVLGALVQFGESKPSKLVPYLKHSKLTIGHNFYKQVFGLLLSNYFIIFLLQMTLWLSCQLPVSKKLLHKDACSWWGKKFNHLSVSSTWRCDHQQAHNWLWTALWGAVMCGIGSCWTGQVCQAVCSSSWEWWWV